MSYLINSKILISVAIVIVIAAAAYGYQVSQTTQLWTPTTTQSSDSSSQGDSQSSSSDIQGQSSGSSSSGSSQGSSGSSSGGSNVKITASEAKSIVAKNYIEDSGSVVGTATLTTMDGKKVYIVTVKKNGKTVGEIYIDANTGKNLGGAGGG